ncbi:MAG: alpha/beta hydrolase [Candidatus Babeliales bacterium]|jgi:proline iminopeptidase
MRIKTIVSTLGACTLLIALASCDVLHKLQGRETIFDRVVSIPQELVLDIPYVPPLCDEIAGLEKGYVEIENGKLYCEEEGTGIPLVLICGGPGVAHHAFHPWFSRVKDCVHLIYYDQRGVGQSSVDDTGKTYTIKQAVEDLECLRKSLKLEKWMVLGWSYGGFLAQCYALTYPKHITGLILVASGDGLKNAKMKPTRQGMFLLPKERDAIRKIWTARDEGKLTLVQESYNAMIAGDWKRQRYYKPTTEELIRNAWYNWQPTPGFRDLICSDKEKIGLDEKFDDFEIPTLICEGKWDLSWDTDKVDFLRKNHPHAQVEVFEKSGHAVFADEPEKFFLLLKNFLEKSCTMQVVCKPGNRLTWPTPFSDLMCQIVMAENFDDRQQREKKIGELFDKAVKTKSNDAIVWDCFLQHFFKPQICTSQA